MKNTKLILPLLALAFVAHSCKKEIPQEEINNVSTSYKALVVKQSETWCGACGSIGFPAFKEIAETYKYKATLLDIHMNDDISATCPEGGYGLTSFFYTGSIPIGGVNVSRPFTPRADDISDSIDFYSAPHQPAKAGIGFSWKIEGANVVVKTKTVAFSALTGKYNLAVYLTEDKVMQEQSGYAGSGDAEFNHVFRRGATSTSWGENIIATSCEAGAVFEDTHTIPIPPTVRNNANLHVAVVLYKMGETGVPIDVMNTNHD
ncbi:MAG: Omp28-related outer membrane protein [Bacteroidia bacterium]|jgi:predicted nucleic-acid-binding Zn-ribbon protein|nr:Omp28-related outer membrane protein [Bacteroidia bacterium]